MRHGLGTVPGAVTRGRRAARALRGAGSEAGALGWESEIRGSLRSQTAGSWEGDQGAGRGPRSHSSGGRPAFTSTCVHTPPPSWRHSVAQSGHTRPASTPASTRHRSRAVGHVTQHTGPGLGGNWQPS